MRRSFPMLPTALVAGVLSALLVALLGLPAATLAQSDAKVTGEVLYRERIILPPSALVIVQLQDVSTADAPAVVIDQQTIEPQGKAPPYAFELTYDAAKIDTRFTYAVRAEIKDGDRLLFTTTERYPVITQGNPVSGVQVVVKSVGGAAPQPVTLPPEMLDRDWNLAGMQRGPGNLTRTTGAGLTIRFGADGRVSGSGGCNGFGGAYTVGANRSLALSQLISTLKACAPVINTLEQEYFNALKSVSSYTLDGASGLQLSYNNGQGLLSYTIAVPAPTPTPQEQACFPETGKCVGGRFLSYWRQNGGLAVFGYPLSDQLTESDRLVQYFERQRFELHPENAAPYDVLLGRLGDELLRRQGVDWFGLPKASGAKAGCRYFPETQHSVCDQRGGPSFLSYWSANGLEFDGKRGKSTAESLALFGLPLTEPMTATLSDGKPYQVQWFERARFEWHPKNPAAYRVLLGRLGAEVTSAASPGDNQGVAPPPADVTLTNSDNGASVGLKAGQTLAVRLDSNPTTGYSWQVSEVNGGVLKQQGDPLFLRPVDAPLGAGGVQIFSFTAAAGQTKLTLVYKRPFEPNAKPADTFSVQVTVQ